MPERTRTLGLGSWSTLRKIVLPAALPSVLTGMRISLGIALILVVISEMVASTDGLGYYVLFAQRSFRVKEMYAAVVALGLLGYGLNASFTAVEKRLLHWHFDAHRPS